MLIVPNGYFQKEDGHWYGQHGTTAGVSRAFIYDCDACSNTFVRLKCLLKKNGKKFCTKKCANSHNKGTLGLTREKASGWKGGRRKINGYIQILSENHPFADSNGCVLEHRLVMEEIIGRYLTKDETVHHINGQRDDNRPQNLELWASKHPKGSRVKDLVEFAKEILIKYDKYELFQDVVIRNDKE